MLGERAELRISYCRLAVIPFSRQLERRSSRQLERRSSRQLERRSSRQLERRSSRQLERRSFPQHRPPLLLPPPHRSWQQREE